jgi:hypothetical protein
MVWAVFIWISVGTSDEFFLVVKGPAAYATDASQSWGLLCNPVIKMVSFFRFSV